MRQFRFRADAALQLRRREHDQALAHLARSHSALISAQHDVDAAAREIEEADAAFRATSSGTTIQQHLDWYRSWRLRWAAERHRREQQRRAREADVHGATKIVGVTHQRVRSLERLHELALSAWRREADREERQTMDDLATMRYTRRKDSM
jgi:flagellar biosynthesis chaperone FliJ